MKRKSVLQLTTFAVVLLGHLILFFGGSLEISCHQATTVKLTFGKLAGGGKNELVKGSEKKLLSKKTVSQKVKAPEAAHDEVSSAQSALAPVEGSGSTGGNGSGQGLGEGAGEGPSDLKKLYGAKISELLNQHKKYPLMASRLQQEGRVVLNLTLSKEGELLDVRMVKGSAFESLNRAALEMVKEVDRFPPAPEEMAEGAISFNVPIEYKLE